MSRKKNTKLPRLSQVTDKDRRLLLMHFEENRIASFEDWPFDGENCKCTPEKMAEAGFFHCPGDHEPDLVKCFVCQKELDGWEPTDDPWLEHQSHSGHCEFLKWKSGQHDMTVEDLFKLEGKRQVNIMRKTIEQSIEDFRKYAKNAREQLETMAD